MVSSLKINRIGNFLISSIKRVDYSFIINLIHFEHIFNIERSQAHLTKYSYFRSVDKNRFNGGKTQEKYVG